MNESSAETLKVVFDTNLYIAAFLKAGLADFLLRLAAESRFEIYACEEILGEIGRKLLSKPETEKARLEIFLNHIRKLSRMVSIEKYRNLNAVALDPEDNKIVACALAAEAHLIVSLDKHLLKLKKFKGIGIIHPKTLTWMIPDY